MSRHAILGSRRYGDLDAVRSRVRQLVSRHGVRWILCSGGSQGVCLTAEKEYARLGGRILRLAPVRLPASSGETCFGVSERRISAAGTDVVRHELTFDDYRSAAMYRSMLIAERADHGDIFWDGQSRGAAGEIEFFLAAETPLRVFR